MLLSTEEKADLLWEKGLFIDSQTGAFYNKALYHFGNFYVQLTLDRCTNEITDITPCKTPAALEKMERLVPILN